MFCSLVAISVVLSLEVLLCTVVSRVREVRFARRERKLEPSPTNTEVKEVEDLYTSLKSLGEG